MDAKVCLITMIHGKTTLVDKDNIHINSKAIHLGYYKDPLLASYIYDKAAKDLFNQYAKTNF